MKINIDRRGGKGSVWPVAGVLLSIFAFMSAVALSAPASAQDGCAWYGTAPFCDGECPAGTVYTGQRSACVTGSKLYCCPRKYLSSGINCKWVGKPGSMVHVCDEAFIEFSVKNSCNAVIDIKVELDSATVHGWVTGSYRFSPGQVGYIGKTKNRYVYVTANSVDGKRAWPREQIDMGNKLNKKFTHNLTCP